MWRTGTDMVPLLPLAVRTSRGMRRVQRSRVSCVQRVSRPNPFLLPTLFGGVAAPAARARGCCWPRS
ncbi:hypothetical protein HRbin30_00707 [bacterium HR30]|nr:hypothetical protein HRbin30_00707 [bacterium HR30]